MHRGHASKQCVWANLCTRLATATSLNFPSDNRIISTKIIKTTFILTHYYRSKNNIFSCIGAVHWGCALGPIYVRS